MLIKEVSIEEILNSKEKRVKIQNDFIKRYKKPILSFTLNIPGNVKVSEDIEKVFFLGKIAIYEELKNKDISVIDKYEILENTGYGLIISLDSNANFLKKIMINLEENHILGRLFDIDIINVDFQKLSRKKFRKCFICDRQAQECARNQTHSIFEVHNKVMSIIKSGINKNK